ncbi:MAG: asparagine synthase (glutamine-hydrolyzing) [Phycisphaerales bacterium]|nr:asparagine synthase (glutamine-hydrolyzing) [Phycisphaerales bacterium]
MCGIAGILLDEIDPTMPVRLSAMTQTMFHRGPDDGGGVVFGMGGKPTVERRFPGKDDAPDWSFVPAKLGIASRRLSIVDRSDAGRQPMASEDGRVWLVYNGEIYNHCELRDELVAQGMQFRGHSDTEVLLNGYRAWGGDVFARLEGMFACAVVDWAAGKMFLARDFFGIKPLYLCRFDGGMAFASEIKALLALPGQPAGINEGVLRDFLCDGRIDTSEETIFEDIWSLPGGRMLELDLRGKGTMHAGGVLRDYGGIGATRWADPVIGLRASLEDSVRSHLQGEVLVGSCLSGGLDSSSIVCIAHALRTSGEYEQLSQHTFTAVLPGDALDESGYAQAVVEACVGLESHRVAPSAERFTACVRDLVWHQEQPFGSPSIYLQWEVMRLAREQGVTVLLDGQGGDELFCGYEGYIPMFLADLLRRGKFGRFRRELKAAKSGHYAGRTLLKHVVASLLPARTRDKMRRAEWAVKRPWLDPDIFAPDAAPNMEERLAIKREPPLELDGSAFESRWWSMIRSESLPSLLRFEDRNSMAFSIEARVPMLAGCVPAIAFGGGVGESSTDRRTPVNADDKIVDGKLKAILRDAMRDVVPDKILYRTDKIGFSAPTAQWMRGGMADWWKERVTSQSFLDRGCFDAKGVLALVNEFEGGDDSAALPLWRLAITEEWARVFLDR